MSETALVSSCFLEGKDSLGNSRIERTKRYLRYYLAIQDHLGFSKIHLIDNQSDLSLVEEVRKSSDERVQIDSYVRLERGDGPDAYCYCWRALYALQALMDRYSKIICIDSDGFVLTHALARHIRQCDSGWVSFHCETWDFPESSIFILNQDAYERAKDYFKVPWIERLGKQMERDLPFTHVEKTFRCGRFGEKGKPPQDETMDFYGQSCLDIDLEFGRFR